MACTRTFKAGNENGRPDILGWTGKRSCDLVAPWRRPEADFSATGTHHQVISP